MNIITLATRFIDQIVFLIRRFRKLLVIMIIASVALIAVQQFLWTTQKTNIFVRTDSIAYLWSAENLVNGLGIGRIDGGGNFVPYTHWPPLYPAFLAGFKLLGFTALDGARLFGGVCIFLMITLIGLIVAILTDYSPFYVAVFSLIIILSPYFFDTTYYAMSEPLYMVLSLASILLLEKYLSSTKKIYLVLTTLLVGMTLLTRYVGISLLVACLIMLALQKKTWRSKLLDCGLTGTISLVPTIIWFVRNSIDSGYATNWVFSIYPFAQGELLKAGQVVLGWINPTSQLATIGVVKTIALILMTIVISALYFRSKSHQQSNPLGSFVQLILVYTLSYGLFVVAARLMFDPYIPLYEARILFPFFVGILFLAVEALYRFQVTLQRKGWLAPIIVVGIYVFIAWAFIHSYRTEYLTLSYVGRTAGYGVSRDIDPNMVSILEQYPLQDYRYYSDDIEKLYFESPNSINSYSIFSMQPEEVKSLLSKTSSGKAVIVLFEQKDLGPAYQDAIPGLQPVYSDGASIYVIDK